MGIVHAANPISASSYQLQDLGAFDWEGPYPSPGIDASAINALGEVLGTSRLPKPSGIDLWHDGTWMTNPYVPSAAAPNGGYPVAFNDEDQIVAALYKNAGSRVASYVILKPTETASQWVKLPAHPVAVPSAIGDSGVVIGRSSAGAVEWLPTAAGYVEKSFPDFHFAAVDASGRIVGSPLLRSAVKSPKLLAALWLTNGKAIVLDSHNPTAGPESGCSKVASYVEQPSNVADAAGPSGSTVVLVVGMASTTSSGCPGDSTRTSSVPTLWKIAVEGSHIAEQSGPTTISTPSGPCGSVDSVNSSGDIVALCQGKLTLIRGAKAVGLSAIFAASEPQGWVSAIRDDYGSFPAAIDSQGQILGGARLQGSTSTHFVLLTPSPNPLGTIFSNSFDAQSPGSLTTGPGVNQFTFILDSGGMKVENDYFDSAPNALDVNVGAAPSVYARKEYHANFVRHDLSFSVVLGSDFKLSPSGFTAISSTETGSTTSTDGLVELVIGGNMQLFMTYIDTSGIQHYLYSGLTLATETSYDIQYDEVAGDGTGSLALYVNGAEVTEASGLDLPDVGVELFKVGDVYTPASTGSGTIYYDNVVATNPAA